MKPFLSALLLLPCFVSAIAGCGRFDSPVEIHLNKRSYAWGNRVTVTYDFEEPPAGVQIPVYILLVGYQAQSSGPSKGKEVRVFEKELGVLVNERLSAGVTPTSLSSIETSLPASMAELKSLASASATIGTALPSAPIQWAIVAHAPNIGAEDREDIELR